MNEDFFQSIQTLLKNNRHFDQAVLSLWMNHYSELSAAEIQSVESHLEICPSCQRLFENVLDEELELDPEKRVIGLFYDSGHHHNGRHIRIFEDASRSVTLTITSAEKAQLVFTKIPPALEGQKARIELAGVSFRTPSIQTGHSLTLGHIGMETVASITITSVPRPASAETAALAWMNSPPLRYLAAAVVLIVLAGTALYFNRQESAITVDAPDRRDSLATADSSKKIVPVPEEKLQPRPETALADNFTPNAVLEAHIQRTYRGEIQLENITPAGSETLAVPIQFNWIQPDGDRVLTVSIVNNHNEKIWEHPA
ncbi:zf-HC2 domain-containing protein, partial [bacterium]|nr:zf-HC2 domain-containing protein [bacterium]